MKPNKQTDTLTVGELIRRLDVRKITRTRFSIDMPGEQLLNHVYAAYVVELNKRHHEIILDDATKEHIREAAAWLGDSQGQPGLMMAGLYGNGKTTLLMAMCNLINYLFDSNLSTEKKEIRIINAKEIAEMVGEGQHEAFRKLCNEEMLAIDEVGEEPAEIILYGRLYTPIRDLLEKRYASQKLTIIATNLVENKKAGKKQLTEHYGARVVDRLREMMKIITFHNPSYRTKP